jgi:CSLREA domain-containing protein
VFAAAPAGAATITVNTTADSSADDGSCTLREAVTAANTDTASGAAVGECPAGAGADNVAFSISGPSPHVIAPASDLPDLVTPMTIDGSTDPQLIALDGNSSSDPFPSGFYVTGDNVSINELAIVRWYNGVFITDEADSTTVSNSWVGTNPGGAAGFGNTLRGIDIRGGASNTLISDNVIASNAQEAVKVAGDDTTGATLTGNLIGIKPDGTAALPNNDAVTVSETAGTRIGGPEPGDGNVISGNTGRAIAAAASTTVNRPVQDLVVQGNFIGTDPSGLIDLGNGGTGIDMAGDVRSSLIEGNTISGNGGMGILLRDFAPWNLVGPSDTAIRGNRIGVGTDGSSIPNAFQGISIGGGSELPILGTEVGGTSGLTPGGACTGDCNVIAGNASSGVYVDGEQSMVSILGNEIRGNGGLGIELVPFSGSTPNDLGDLDIGGNELQNFPVLQAALADVPGGGTLVTGSFNSVAGATYRIEVFENSAADPTGFGEGETLLGAFDLTTDGAGDAYFGELLAEASAAVAPLSATATRTDVPAPFTSEFSLVQAEGCDQSDVGATGLLVAGGSGEVLCGLAGDDVLRGSSGGDIFNGGDDTDTADLSLSAGPVDADLSSGRVVGDGAVDLMAGIENLIGSAQADSLTGDAGANTISGGDSADVIDPGAGADSVFGGEGDDVIDVADGEADLVVDCGPGADTVEADSTAVDSESIYTGCETINRPAPPVTYKCAGLVATKVGTNASETILGTPGRDIIVSRGGADVIRGYAGNDVICGGDLRDTVFAGDGIDVVYGLDGNDILNGDRGNDRIFGGNGRDTVTGGDNADVIFGGNDNDVLSGIVGNDTIRGGFGNDTLNGGANLDRLLGEGGNDILRGGDAADTLLGGNGNDSLFGDNGADRLFGGFGSDLLKGGNGFRDVAFGQGGFDRLDGGAGKGDVCNGGPGRDRRAAPRCEKRRSIP